MVNAMEGTLHEFQNNNNNSSTDDDDDYGQDAYLIQDTNPSTIAPGMISDTYSSSDDNSLSDQVRSVATTTVVVQAKKKRSATIPNFLFRSNTKKNQQEEAMKRNQSLNESNNTWVQRKPIRIN